MRSQVRAFTMFDYLYRLRIKANYIDDELFSQGPEKDSDAEEFTTRMQSIVAATLLGMRRPLVGGWVATKERREIDCTRPSCQAPTFGERLTEF